MEQTPNLNPGLNLDVLMNIMSMSDTRTVSRLMRASRELYPKGPKYLLHNPVRLKRESSVPSFVAFMRVNDTQRFQLLKSLEISTGRLSEAEADVLEKFLLDFEPLLKIQRLTIDRAEEFFESSPGLSGAFSLIRSVKHLTLSEIGRRANTFLIHSRARLVSADLSMVPPPSDDDSSASDDEDEAEGDDDFRNPIVQLRASQDTLEALNVRWCDTFSDAGLEYEQIYPHVKTLTLAASELPTTVHYARAFPNVRTLTLECDPREFEILGDDIEDLHAFRTMNKMQLILLGAWTALKAVHGTLVDHFLLGLNGPVEQVHITGNFMDKRMWRSVLTTCRPAYVNFQGFDVDLFFGGEFRRLMRGQLLLPVRCFEIMLFFGGVVEPEDVDVPKALEALVEGIGKMPSLRSFGLTLCGFGLQPGLEDLLFNLDRPTGKLCAAEEHLRDLDLDALALRIRQAVPGLETIAVSLIGHRARPNGYATLGEGAGHEDGAVERIPLKHASRITMFDPAKMLRNSSMSLFPGS